MEKQIRPKININCSMCGDKFDITLNHYKNKTKWGGKNFYCPVCIRKKRNSYISLELSSEYF